jgi:glycosyltransferase involved in cell wall biosynthesis
MIENSSSQPAVSIIIPVYNGSNYLRSAIDSALAQTYRNVEVIVVNDGSNDGGVTEQIVLSYGDRIRYIRKQNGGVASALNAGIGEMTGDYFSWLSHDDIYYPNKLIEQVASMAGFSRPVVLYSDYEVIDSQARVLEWHVTADPCRPEEFCRQLIIDYPIQGCSALIPKECFATVGLFNENLRTTQDYDMWFRISQHYDFIHMRRVLLQSRVHNEQGTVTMSPLHVRECNEFLIDGMLKLLRDLELTSFPGSGKQFLAECLTSFSRDSTRHPGLHCSITANRYSREDRYSNLSPSGR